MNLLAKMEAELNYTASKIKSVSLDGTLTIRQRYDQVVDLNIKTAKLRLMIRKYAALQNEFLELTGKLSLSY